MTAREDLIVTISDALLATAQSDKYGLNAVTEADLEAVPVADAILAAGYRTPRVITTFTELEALPGESVIRDGSGMVYESDYIVNDPANKWWITTGSGGRSQHSGIDLPATVLYEPEVAL